ncbi:GNAT family N-acetyltransferase [Schlegelella sp. S2-27]|uniref:GNAT family N-acetyltransferase n=1 Tax=Caldimonas mangrovi TaxID=2944811 RepID=A0ABT0YVV9_9BURK|nr:GNAT family N-acetyltransferase [Caldimonas mangrovi]MCM5682875.1 GNAT family N-acetyltransferase [Caldimonas mangrovi]
MKLSFRTATLDDVPAVLALYEAAAIDPPGSADLRLARATFERMQSHPDYRVWLAELDGEPVGTLALAVMDNLAHRCAPSALVEDVAVHPRCQGRGVGRRLIGHAIEQARAKGCYKLALSSNARRQSAHAFYERLGFQPHGISFRVNLDEQ